MRVIVVDDHADLRLMVTFLLGLDDRFEVVGEAANGSEAIALVEKDAPDLMLLDLAMPGMDGLEVLDLCTLRWPGEPRIVVLSGFTATKMREQVLGRGAVGYVEKGIIVGPLMADELYAVWNASAAAA